MAISLEEARRMVMTQHPGWRSHDIDQAARGLVASAAKLDALDALNVAVEQLQADVDAKNAEFVNGLGHSTDAPIGRVGGAASVWDALRDGREPGLWGDLEERSEREARRVAEQASENSRPDGWEY